MENTEHLNRLIRQIKPTNILSFGPDTPALELNNLNVLIGPNGSGKSNLIEIIALMRAAPVLTTSNSDIQGITRRGGGVNEWIWKGSKNEPASIELVVDNPKSNQPLRHLIAFRGDEQAFRLSDEYIQNETPYSDRADAYFYYKFNSGDPVVNTNDESTGRKISRETVDLNVSILAQRRDPESYPEISYLASTYEKFRIYREWAFGRNTVFRETQAADMRSDRLEEDFSNLGLFLSRLRKTPKVKNAILKELSALYDGLTDFEPIIESGRVQVFFTEDDFSIPATRLSDGSLRYLCLLAILCDPDPPPLICIEEPELGLHPDIMPKLADLLVAASERTQIIVTTHSDILVDAMTEQPESIVVCEKHNGQTEMNHLEKKDLAKWLDKYRLGQLWTMGQIGGTRW